MAESHVWRNRIVATEDVDPKVLIQHPRNYKIHTAMQKDAASGVLNQIGWIDAVKVNRTTGFIVNGHLRVTLAIQENQPTVPVDYCELTQEEELLALATFDQLAHVYYQSDKDAIASIISDLDRFMENPELARFMDDWSNFEKLDFSIPDPTPTEEDTEGDGGHPVDPSSTPVAPDIPTPPVSNIKQSVLLLTPDAHADFMKEVAWLEAHWETENQTNTILRAVHSTYVSFDHEAADEAQREA